MEGGGSLCYVFRVYEYRVPCSVSKPCKTEELLSVPEKWRKTQTSVLMWSRDFIFYNYLSPMYYLASETLKRQR